MKRFTCTVLVLAFAATAGCAKTGPSKGEPKTAPEEKAATGDKSGTDVKAAAQKKQDDLVDAVETEEDFEQEVKETITSTNLESELAKLEAEMAASGE